MTTFYIDDKIDTGEMILQEEISITLNDNAGTLHDKLMYLGADLVLKTVKEIESDSVKRKKQDFNEDLKAAPKIYKDSCRIDWDQPLDKIYDFIRGLCPYPTAWTILVNEDDDLFLKIYDVTKEKDDHGLKTGTLLFTKKEMKIAVENGYINLLKIQLPGKRKMETKDVLNGLKLTKTASVV